MVASPDLVVERLPLQSTGRLSGPAAKLTWAILVEDQIVGSVQLKRTREPGVLETGIWLTRRARGRGVGRRALTVSGST